MTLSIRDAHGRTRTDLTDEALCNGIGWVERDLVAGSLNELVLRWSGAAKLIFHLSNDDRYMVTHVDAKDVGLTAIADGDPEEQVTIGIGGEPETWPGDHFIEPVIAKAIAERFTVDGGRDPCVEWRPSTAHR